MGDGLPGDGGQTREAEGEYFVGRRKRRREGDLHFVLVRGNASAAQGQTQRRAAQLQSDLPGETVVPEGENGDGDACAGAEVDARRGDAQLEIGPRCADAQPVGVVRTALVLGVGDGQKISAVGRQRAGETRVGLVGEQAGALVFVVVVEREGLPVGVGESEDGVERGAEPTREYFRDDFLPGLGLEPKHVLVAGAADAAVDGEGQDDRLGGAGVVVGLDLAQVGLGVECDAHGIGELAVTAHGNEKRAGLAVFRLEGEALGGEVPPGKFEGGPFTAARAEREDAGDKRQFADGDAIDKIFAPAVNGVLDFHHIGAVGRNDVAENGVRMETVVVGVGDLTAGGVGETERGLKPARHGVGEIGDEGAGAGDHDDALAFARGETDVVDLAGENLAVHDRGQGDFRDGFWAGVARLGFAVRPRGIGAGGGDAHGFAEFRELAHGKDHRVGEAVGGAEPNFAFAGRGARGHGHFERDGFGEDGADLAVAAGGE